MWKYTYVFISSHSKTFPNVWRESGWSVKAPDRGHQTRTMCQHPHTLQGCTVSMAEWAGSNWFSATLALGSVMSCIRRRGWRQVNWFQILTPPFLAVSSQANHWNPLSPSFFLLPTYLSIHPSIHPSIFYLHPSQQVVVKRKKGSIKRETLWKLQMHKFIAIVQMMIDGQGLRTRAFYCLRASGIWGKSEAGSVGQGMMTPRAVSWGGPRAKSTWLSSSVKEMSVTCGRRRVVAMWDIKLGAEDLFDLDPGLEGEQWEKCGKSLNQTKWMHFWTPFFHSPYVLLDTETVNFLLGYPLKEFFKLYAFSNYSICAYFKMHINTII